MCGNGELCFKWGTMNSGKSLNLLATANNFTERGVPFILLKSSLDTRDGENVIHSRTSQERECIGVNVDTNLYELIVYLHQFSPLQQVLVDEAQFLTPSQVDELAAVVDNFPINITCYGLRTDFQTKLFPGSKRLFEVADKLEEIESFCSCGDKNVFNARVDGAGNILLEGNQVEVGGEDKYVTFCRKCFYKKIGAPYYTN